MWIMLGCSPRCAVDACLSSTNRPPKKRTTKYYIARLSCVVARWRRPLTDGERQKALLLLLAVFALLRRNCVSLVRTCHVSLYHACECCHGSRVGSGQDEVSTQRVCDTNVLAVFFCCASSSGTVCPRKGPIRWPGSLVLYLLCIVEAFQCL